MRRVVVDAARHSNILAEGSHIGGQGIDQVRCAQRILVLIEGSHISGQGIDQAGWTHGILVPIEGSHIGSQASIHVLLEIFVGWYHLGDWSLLEWVCWGNNGWRHYFTEATIIMDQRIILRHSEVIFVKVHFGYRWRSEVRYFWLDQLF